MSRSSRITISAGCACLLAMAFLVFGLRKPPGPVPESIGGHAAPPSSSRAFVRQDSPDGGKPDRFRGEAASGAKGFNQIDAILTDQSADDATTAIKLIELVGRTDISVDERIEALSHAVLLTPDSEGSRLVALAQSHLLAPELGEILLADFHNRPDPTRLAGAVALAKNDTPSVRKEAMELVRFLMVEADSEDKDSEILQKAETKLQK